MEHEGDNGREIHSCANLERRLGWIAEEGERPVWAYGFGNASGFGFLVPKAGHSVLVDEEKLTVVVKASQ